MTDEVGELVLWDNYRQNQAITLMEHQSVQPHRLDGALHPHAGEPRVRSIARSRTCRPKRS